jgi:hypothetical protein
MASSSALQNNFDLNDVPDVQPEIWRPSFLSPKGYLMTNDSVMLDDATTASMARSIITPRDEKLLANPFDADAINDSMAFNIQSTASVSNMVRRLQVRGNEVQSLQNQVLVFQRLLMDFWRRNIVLKQENKELKKLVDSYVNDQGKRYAELEQNKNSLREQHGNLFIEVQNLRFFCPET